MKKKTILDFGSGLGDLKKKIIKKTNNKVINYEVVDGLSEVNHWSHVNFDIIIFSQVLYLLTPDELKDLLLKLKKHNNKLIIICAFSTQSLVNKIGKIILAHSDAHDDTKTTPQEEEKLLLNFCDLIEKKNFFNIFKILKLKFKD